MSQQCWTLIDADHNLHRDTLSLAPDDLGISESRVSLHRLHGGLCDGVDWLEVQNGPLRFVVLPTRGMGVWKAWLGDLEIGWRSPVRGPVHPQFVPIADPTGLGWLDGFDELICRCGLSSNGAPEFSAQGRLLWPLHGRIANLPAHHVELRTDSDRGEIAVRGVVDECRFHFLKLRLTSTIVTRAGEPSFHIIDEVTNLSGAPGEMQLLYHINVGQPLLEPGSRANTAFKSIAPRNEDAAAAIDTWQSYGPPTPGLPEQAFFFEPLAGDDGLARVVLANAASDQGVSVSFPVAQLPYFILWKNTAAYEDGYVTGVEPAMNFPNPRSFEEKHGRVRKLAPGETVRAELDFEIHADRASVSAAEHRVIGIQQKSKPTIHRQPLTDWSA